MAIIHSHSLLLVAALLVLTSLRPAVVVAAGAELTATYLSPPIPLAPGEVNNKLYYSMPFPNAEVDIGVKNFQAEIIYENGSSAPLTDVYLHHWIVINYWNESDVNGTNFVTVGNAGLCPNNSLTFIFGVGAETRGTDTRLPADYAVRIDAGQSIMLNVHAIDTRQTVDPVACLECRCASYNATPPPDLPNYVGGLQCCLDTARCLPLLPNANTSDVVTYYLRYTVHYFVWQDNPSLLPVSIYLLDATYLLSTGCLIEYDVPQCNYSTNGNCIYTLESTMPAIPKDGEIVYAVAHQHRGGINATILHQDGREICTSAGVYGTGSEAGNEKGYLVGMTNCNPETLTFANVSAGDTLRISSLYDNTELHSGVMSLGYIAVYSP